MQLIILAISIALLFSLEVVYFKIADHFNIIDKPNHRSSHTKITIRGGGIIFTIGLLLCPVFFGLHYPFFLTGLFLVAFISFLDDIQPVSSKIRIVVHLIAALLMLAQLGLLQAPVYIIAGVLFFIIASINAINFMDGINGITGIYALVALATLCYLNKTLGFTDSNYLNTALIGVLVFNFFNCRKVAKCFAGDVGSVGIAFILLFFLLQLVIKTQNISYLLFMTVYALDTATTITFRIIRKEKITEAHRSHLYQYLANEKRLPHLFVAVLYGLMQLLINIVTITTAVSSVTYTVLVFIVCLVIFLTLRFIVEGKKHLMVTK